MNIKYITILYLSMHSLIANAWNYNEHAEITYCSYINACESLRKTSDVYSDITDKLSMYCNNNTLKLCLAHMSALAGDHLDEPKKMIRSDDDYKYLVNIDSNIDCRNIDSVITDTQEDDIVLTPVSHIKYCKNMASDGIKLDDENIAKISQLFEKKLVKSRLEQLLEYGALASENVEHFQPKAPDIWKNYFDKMQTLSQNNRKYQIQFANHAFSLHYLEDIYSSGHNGLNRLYLRQDYDNAYHDDFNSTGLFLVSKNNIWHTYGDKYLHEPSKYMLIKSDIEYKYKEIIEELIELSGPNYESNIVASDRLDEFLNKSINDVNSELQYVISLPYEKDGMLDFCFYTDSCDKIEYILINNAILKTNLNDCEEIKGDHIDLYFCYSTRNNVINQATLNTKAFLINLAESDKYMISQIQHDIYKDIPFKYHTIEGAEVTGNGINKSAFIIAYGEEISVTDDRKRHEFNKWGFSLDKKFSKNDKLDEYSLTFNLLGAFNIGEDPYKTEETQKIRLSNMYEIINDNRKILDAFDVSLYYQIFRPLNNITGVSGKLAFGLDNIWQGSNDRNYYGGAGMSFDIHLGKRIFYIDIDALFHQNENYEEDESIRVNIGVRGAAISLR